MPPKPRRILRVDDEGADAGPAGFRSASPRRQGQLDSLCGIYAIVNAFAHAARDRPLRYFPTKRLFMHLEEAATWQRGDTSFIGDGLTHAELKHLCKKAVRFHRKHGYEFQLMSPKSLLPDRPYPRNPEDAHSRCAWFARAASLPASAVILDINTDWISHWSVLSSATGDRLALYDSNGMKTVAADACEPFLVIQTKRAD
jgi:hypothetical protein